MLIPTLLASATALAGPTGEAWVDLPPGVGPRDLREAGLDPAEDHEPGPGGGTRWRVLLGPADTRILERRGWTWDRVRADHRTGAPPAGYHPPEAGDALLADLAGRSGRGWLQVLGHSRLGRPITGLALGQPPGSGAPVLRVLGAHHGDEWTSFELALALAVALVEGDGLDPGITAILDRSTVWIVPYVNPDGVMTGDRHNDAGVDLNRNYDVAWDAATRGAGPAPFSEPETRAVRVFGHHERPFASLSLHAGAANLGWPWNWTTADAPDAPVMTLLAERYARINTTDGFYVTQGAEWYETRGDTNDWSYGRYGALDLTLEASWDRAPPPDALPEVIGEHLEALLAFLDTAPTVSGRVFDADTGAALEARVSVSRPEGDAPVWSDPTTGAFHRLLGPGEATLRIEAAGYAPRTVTVTPALGAPAAVAIALTAEGLGAGALSPSVARAPRTHRLPRAATEVTLLRAGADPVVLDADGDDLWLDPTGLPGGWWTVVLDDGTVLRDAVWIDAPEAARIEGWRLEGDGVEVFGAGFATGARAWALDREAGRRLPLEVRDASPTRLWLGIGDLPTDRPIDLGLWTAGAELGIDDLWNERFLADQADPEPLRALGGGACDTGSGHQGGHGMSILVGALAWWAPRRRSA